MRCDTVGTNDIFEITVVRKGVLNFFLFRVGTAAPSAPLPQDTPLAVSVMQSKVECDTGHKVGTYVTSYCVVEATRWNDQCSTLSL